MALAQNRWLRSETVQMLIAFDIIAFDLFSALIRIRNQHMICVGFGTTSHSFAAYRQIGWANWIDAKRVKWPGCQRVCVRSKRDKRLNEQPMKRQQTEIENCAALFFALLNFEIAKRSLNNAVINSSFIALINSICRVVRVFVRSHTADKLFFAMNFYRLCLWWFRFFFGSVVILFLSLFSFVISQLQGSSKSKRVGRTNEKKTDGEFRSIKCEFSVGSLFNWFKCDIELFVANKSFTLIFGYFSSSSSSSSCSSSFVFYFIE